MMPFSGVRKKSDDAEMGYMVLDRDSNTNGMLFLCVHVDGEGNKSFPKWMLAELLERKGYVFDTLESGGIL